jgi:cell pole-organizing protein PopZ
MAQTAKAQEPSMEEILASIRRIIADDESKPVARTSEPPKPVPPTLSPVPPPATQPDFTPPKTTTSHPRATGAIEAVEHQPTGENRTAPSDILELTESIAAPSEETAAGFRTIDGHPDVVFADELPPKSPEPPVASIARAQSDNDEHEQLLSRTATAAVDSAFNSLAHTVLVQNARTLEDLVREMLRPMLKSWLDDNLPGLVERLVRSEIERVSHGRG